MQVEYHLVVVGIINKTIAVLGVVGCISWTVVLEESVRRRRRQGGCATFHFVVMVILPLCINNIRVVRRLRLTSDGIEQSTVTPSPGP